MKQSSVFLLVVTVFSVLCVSAGAADPPGFTDARELAQVVIRRGPLMPTQLRPVARVFLYQIDGRCQSECERMRNELRLYLHNVMPPDQLREAHFAQMPAEEGSVWIYVLIKTPLAQQIVWARILVSSSGDGEFGDPYDLFLRNLTAVILTGEVMEGFYVLRLP